jgi:adenylylsulfate kinase
MFIEQKRRSIIKTISWRIWATITTTALVFFFVGEVKVALTIGVIEVLVKMALYFLHERWWNGIRFGKKEIKPAVIWFTGLPCSGKTTLAKAVTNSLEKKGIRTEHIDNENVKNIFPRTGFTKEERSEHIKRIGYLAGKLEKNGVFVMASFISPYKETRNLVKRMCNNSIEVYVSTPLEVCEKRDTKGMYAKARKGEIKHFTGISDPYEVPDIPDITIDTTNVSVEEAVKKVMKVIN